MLLDIKKKFYHEKITMNCYWLNMRTLIKIAKIRASFPDSWSELALYTIGA
jgi:hypothetical protein